MLHALGKKVIYDAHEDFPAQVKNKPYLRPALTPLAVAGARLALVLARRADHVIAATETIARRFPAAKTSVVHNYPELRAAEETAVPVERRDQAAVYVGALSKIRGATVMADAVGSSLWPAGWELRVAGRTPTGLATVLDGRPGWSRVDYQGDLPPEAARDQLLRARVGLVVFQDTEAHRDALPTKMFEYFAAGLPVIASDFPLWRSIIVDNDCGLTVDQTDPEAVAGAVSRYAADPALLERHGVNARRVAVTRLNWAREEQTLAAVYRAVLEGR
jgi:glycosyltransferase involved in cell wall biosynthesis